MRNVICAMNLSIDGCYDHTKLSGSEAIHQYFADLLKEVDLGISGRKMYELMNPYWQEAAKERSGVKGTDDFADTITAIESIVVSRTMPEVPGGPRIIRDNVADEVRKLKQLPGKKISIGGISLRSQLIAEGLIDEFYFVIQPILIGKGPKFLDETGLPDSLKLELVDTKILEPGCVAMHYLKK
ncbi:dihydrofolate reductase family protein [Mucilaginibacter pedocola]|uniref:Bacterial bifunctional deaminase-reductase C-terminal domain-containing protein n=1 Tax=Mucilaginibacter pedocola TaxID=1792845 RepID=A0A1S9P6G3_9SPHI|nr:dihydrofolate reductase family protein [Mucilaginibacter pedocola]OOQ56553.1 hypothetical protein BC343_19145 [Mucilaginibacter pedocola]